MPHEKVLPFIYILDSLLLFHRKDESTLRYDDGREVTNTYHIGLPLLPPRKEIVIQLSSLGARELNLLHLHTLANLLNQDPELVHTPPTEIRDHTSTVDMH